MRGIACEDTDNLHRPEAESGQNVTCKRKTNERCGTHRTCLKNSNRNPFIPMINPHDRQSHC